MIPDAAIEAAINAVNFDPTDEDREMIRAALEAAMPFLCDTH